MIKVDAAAIPVVCPIHGPRCGPPRAVFEVVSSEPVFSPWGVETNDLLIYSCREDGFRFRPAPSQTQVESYYEAPYHESMEGQRNLARARWARKENEERIHYLKSYLPGGRVLDLGCSTGILASQLTAAGFEVEASDVSPYACDRVRALLPGLPVHCGAIAEYADGLAGRFDAIAMMDVIEHLPDVVDALRRLHQMLRPEGLLFLRTPTLNSPFYFAAESGYRLSAGRYRHALLRVYHAEHLVFFDESSIARVLGAANFEVVDISSDPLLWQNFKAAEMCGSRLQNLALAAIYFSGRLLRRGHGMRVMARRK